MNGRLVATGHARATELLLGRGRTTPQELLIPLADARAVERRLTEAEDRPKDLAQGVWSTCPAPD